jgi:ABC-type multidrug transport system fused ATPase/permease subunit
MPELVAAAVIVTIALIGIARHTSRRLRDTLTARDPGPGPGGTAPGGRGVRALLHPYRRAVAIVVALDTLAIGAGLLAPWPVKAVIDNIATGSVNAPFGVAGPRQLVLVAVAVGILLVVTLCLLEYLSTVLSEAIGASAGVELRRAAFARLVRLPVSSPSLERNGDLVTRLTTDVNRAQEAALDRWRVLVPNLLAMVGMAALMAVLSPPLAAITACVVPLTGILFWVRQRRVAGAQGVARSRSGELAARIAELGRSIPTVQAFGREADEARRLDSAGRHAGGATVAAATVSARLAPLSDVVVAINLAVVLAMGAAQVRSHQLSMGGLVVFLTYLGAMQQPVRAFSRLSRTLGSGAASRARLNEILAEPVLEERSDGIVLGPTAPVVAADHVDYRYPHGRAALHDLTLTLPAREITSIVGPNGAGKSTFLSLLLRLDDPNHGSITFDGVDARDIDLASLRRRVAFVPQDVWLTDGTLLDNVTYGTPSATLEQLEAAARLALVDEFVGRLPAGWATPLGEGGAALSGGQRRRVALARAVLRDCPVLLLDEPTTGLDAEAERLVIEAIKSVAAGRTTVIVTHDPELASISARIVVLEHGTVSPLLRDADRADLAVARTMEALEIAETVA